MLYKHAKTARIGLRSRSNVYIVKGISVLSLAGQGI